jgi:hypothetical protein
MKRDLPCMRRLKHFQEKWIPAFRQKMRPFKKAGALCGSTKSQSALGMGAMVVGALLFPAALLPMLAQEAPRTAAPPGLKLSEPGVAWAGFVEPKEPNYAVARLFNDFAQPATGIGPVSDGPAHPYVNNEVAREMRIPPTYRVADLDNAAARNLMPWAREALAKQNALVLSERNGESREARCWETGVPAFHLNPGQMHIIQAPKQIVLFLVGRTRHIWLDVPHSANPKPSWYGESVGHYEGDTLVVDTIGFNGKTFVDSYRTPHTDKLHVVERFRVINDGATLEVAFRVEDPGTFYQPWSGTRNRHRVTRPYSRPVEFECPEANDDYYNLGLEPVPTAEKPEF